MVNVQLHDISISYISFSIVMTLVPRGSALVEHEPRAKTRYFGGLRSNVHMHKMFHIFERYS